MLSKINAKIEQSGGGKIVRKIFQRNYQTIETKSAYINDKLYFREWKIKEYDNSFKKYMQAYSNGKPFKNSKQVLDFSA